MAQKPLILAVETSGRTGSVAIAVGEQILAESAFSAPMRHSAEILPAVCGLLERFDHEPHQIEHIYISIGPGSFTGLRIAVTLAKTMHLANSAKLVAVDTLDVIAANTIDLIPKTIVRNTSGERRATSDKRIAVILNAKREQFFIAVYKRTSGERQATSDGIWKKTLPDSLMTASQFLDKFTAADQTIWLLGEGLVYHKDKFKTQGVKFLDQALWYPKAAKVHLLGYQKALQGRFADALTLQPTYLRKPEIGEKRKSEPPRTKENRKSHPTETKQTE